MKVNDITPSIKIKKGASTDVIDKANNDSFIDGFISNSNNCYSIMVNDTEVGVIEIIPHGKFKKVSVVYIELEFQQKGLAKFAINTIIASDPSFAFVEVNNEKSNNLFSSIGYHIDGQREKNGVIYNLFVRGVFNE